MLAEQGSLAGLVEENTIGRKRTHRFMLFSLRFSLSLRLTLQEIVFKHPIKNCVLYFYIYNTIIQLMFSRTNLGNESPNNRRTGNTNRHKKGKPRYKRR